MTEFIVNFFNNKNDQKFIKKKHNDKTNKHHLFLMCLDNAGQLIEQQ